jgi:hypothetical protein
MNWQIQMANAMSTEIARTETGRVHSKSPLKMVHTGGTRG